LAAALPFLLAVALEPLLRRWVGRAIAGVVLMERVNLETGAVRRDDMAGRRARELRRSFAIGRANGDERMSI
jgi:hypothetical protein